MKNLEEYRPSDEHVQKAGMEWEVEAGKLVIDDLLQRLRIEEDKIVATGALTHEEAQREVESLFAIYKDIYANPDRTGCHCLSGSSIFGMKQDWTTAPFSGNIFAWFMFIRKRRNPRREFGSPFF